MIQIGNLAGHYIDNIVFFKDSVSLHPNRHRPVDNVFVCLFSLHTKITLLT